MCLRGSFYCRPFYDLQTRRFCYSAPQRAKSRVEAELLSTVCSDVETEPALQDISGEQLNRGSNRAQDARLDIHARGFWEHERSAFFRHPNAESYKKCTKNCDYTFHIGNELIEIVQDYTYLGTRICSSGNFTLSLEHLRQKALHAFFSQRRHTDFSTLKPSLACRKMFDTMIQPILTYNSEVWGAFC